MRKIAANYIFPVTAPPIKNGHLILDDNNCIIDVVDTNGQITEIEGLEYYSGILVPGFIYIDTCDDFNRLQTIILNKQLELFNAQQKKAGRFLWSRGIQAIAQKQWQNTPEKYPLVLNEMLKQLNNGSTTFEFLLKEYTIENAKKLKMESNFGSFNLQKNPGVLLLSGFNYKTFSITEKTQLTRLV